MPQTTSNLKNNIYSFIEQSFCTQGEPCYEKQSPTTGETLYAVHSPTDEQLNTALKSGHQASLAMKKLSPQQRSHALQELAQQIQIHKDAFVQLEVEDTGRAIKEILEYDIPSAIDCLNYYAKLILELPQTKYDSSSSQGYVIQEPYGLCLGIGAWNYPLQISAWKLAPALAAGNSMILKPSEVTPRSSLLLASLALETSLPKASVQTIVGTGQVGAQLIQAKEVRKVSLTGSVETGRKVASLAGEHLKPVTVELGGKSPLIIAEPFNLESAVQLALLANFYSTGQVCTNGTRVFIPESRKQDFIDLAISETKKLRIGDPFDPNTLMGPLISQNQLEKVTNIIRRGESEGAIKYQPVSLENKSGFYISPVIFSDCTDDMSITTEEIFGPVMSVLTYQTLDEAIERANKLEFGLAAGVVCEDSQIGEKICSELQAGVCWLNTYNETPLSLPFGGMKSSGIGRENGLQGLLNYSQSKTVLISKNKKPSFY